MSCSVTIINIRAGNIKLDQSLASRTLMKDKCFQFCCEISGRLIYTFKCFWPRTKEQYTQWSCYSPSNWTNLAWKRKTWKAEERTNNRVNRRVRKWSNERSNDRAWKNIWECFLEQVFYHVQLMVKRTKSLREHGAWGTWINSWKFRVNPPPQLA